MSPDPPAPRPPASCRWTGCRRCSVPEAQDYLVAAGRRAKDRRLCALVRARDARRPGRHPCLAGRLAARAVPPGRLVRGAARHDARHHPARRGARIPSQPAPARPADLPRQRPGVRCGGCARAPIRSAEASVAGVRVALGGHVRGLANGGSERGGYGPNRLLVGPERRTLALASSMFGRWRQSSVRGAPNPRTTVLMESGASPTPHRLSPFHCAVCLVPELSQRPRRRPHTWPSRQLRDPNLLRSCLDFRERIGVELQYGKDNRNRPRDDQ